MEENKEDNYRIDVSIKTIKKTSKTKIENILIRSVEISKDNSIISNDNYEYHEEYTNNFFCKLLHALFCCRPNNKKIKILKITLPS